MSDKPGLHGFYFQASVFNEVALMLGVAEVTLSALSAIESSMSFTDELPGFVSRAQSVACLLMINLPLSA